MLRVCVCVTCVCVTCVYETAPVYQHRCRQRHRDTEVCAAYSGSCRCIVDKEVVPNNGVNRNIVGQVLPTL